jgi:hypothetical protein
LRTHDKETKVGISNIEVAMSIKLEPQWPSTYVLILQIHRLPVADISPVWKNIYRFFG